MTPLLSQIVHLTKCLVLRPEDSLRNGANAQFISGKPTSTGFRSGIGLGWWYSDEAHQVLEAVASLVIKSSPDFRGCDAETVSNLAIKTLQEVCVEKSLFDVDAVFFSQRRTLYDCRAIPVPQYAAAILHAISENLRALICRRCVIFAVPSFQITSFNLTEDSVFAIAKEDKIAWQDLIERGYLFNGWTPEHPFIQDRTDQVFSPPSGFQCVIVSEEYGTQAGAQLSSILKFRRLMVVLFSIASQRAIYPYHRSMIRPFEFCIQFPHQSSTDAFISRNDCNSLIPYFSSEIPIGADELALTKDWYSRWSRCSSLVKTRIEKGVHFLSRGINSDDIEAYINYFVTLDALFGERGSVEKSILNGVSALNIDASYIKKTPWLFDLRNEIVHGGSRYISEWPKYSEYTQHFRSKPQSDVGVLAQLAVLGAPYVLGP